MDTFLFDIRLPLEDSSAAKRASQNANSNNLDFNSDFNLRIDETKSSRESCHLTDVSIVHQICSFKQCMNPFRYGACFKNMREELKNIQDLNHNAKLADWVISSMILVFVTFNFFNHLDKKLRTEQKLARQQGLSRSEVKKGKIIHNSLLQLLFYILSLVGFPIMFSLPFYIHEFWEIQEVKNQQMFFETQCDDSIDTSVLNIEVLKDEVLTSVLLIVGCALWFALILSAIYHLIRMILFSNKTEPASIMCHY